MRAQACTSRKPAPEGRKRLQDEQQCESRGSSRVVVNDLGVGLVEARRQVGLGHGQADGVTDALAQGAGGHLDTVRQEVLGVAGGGGAPLAELLQVVGLQAAQQGVGQS